MMSREGPLSEESREPVGKFESSDCELNFGRAASGHTWLRAGPYNWRHESGNE